MSDLERIHLLQQRLQEMTQQTVPAWQQPMQSAARLLLQTEVSDLGRRLARRQAANTQPKD